MKPASPSYAALILIITFFLGFSVKASAENSNDWRLRLDYDGLSHQALRAEAEELKQRDTPEAFARLGYLYRTGKGLDKDESKARELLEQAAAAGDPFGLYNLGVLYEKGSAGLSQDPGKALELYQSAFNQGDMFAPLSIGYMYSVGLGLQKDKSQAFKYYSRAAELGNPLGWNNLGAMYMGGSGVEKDPAKAVPLYRKAAEAGVSVAARNLGNAYKIGESVPRNYLESERWFRLGAEQGDTSAQFELGNFYLFGLGGDADPGKARHWLGKAAEAGHEDAKTFLSALESLQRASATQVFPVFEWSNPSPALAQAMADDRTYDYIPPDRLSPFLTQVELTTFRKADGTREVSLKNNGDHTRLEHTPDSGYSEWTLPHFAPPLPDSGESWRSIVFDFSFDSGRSAEDYEIPLQFRTGLSPTNKIQLTLTSKGTIRINAVDTKADTEEEYITWRELETQGRTKIEYLLSTAGFWFIYVNDALFDSGKLPAGYVTQGLSNKFWFEGNINIYGLAIRQLYQEANVPKAVGLAERSLKPVDSAVASYFGNIVGDYGKLDAIKRYVASLQSAEAGSPDAQPSASPKNELDARFEANLRAGQRQIEKAYGLNNGQVLEIDTWNYQSHERTYLRRTSLQNADGKPYTVYRVGLLIRGQFSNNDLSGESITLPLHYEVVVDETSKQLVEVVNLLRYGENEAFQILTTELGLD